MAFFKTSEDKRRVDRSSAGLPVELVLYDNGEENILAGPSSASVSDISRFGAGLILPEIRVNHHHLFYGPKEMSCLLYLEKGGPDGSKALSIQVRPKWYRLEDDKESQAYCLGVEFIKPKNVDDISQLRNMAEEFVFPKKN